MDVHPSGDHLIVGGYDRKLCWFDLELSEKPYKVLRQVCATPSRFPSLHYPFVLATIRKPFGLYIFTLHTPSLPRLQMMARYRSSMPGFTMT